MTDMIMVFHTHHRVPYQATISDVRTGERTIRTRRIMHDTDSRSPILEVPELVYDKYGSLNYIFTVIKNWRNIHDSASIFTTSTA